MPLTLGGLLAQIKGASPLHTALTSEQGQVWAQSQIEDDKVTWPMELELVLVQWPAEAWCVGDGIVAPGQCSQGAC